jgi:hypothetical protein
VICVCMKTYSVMSDLSLCVKTYFVMSDLRLCENVFCNEWSEFVWKRILITEYVFIQTQITHYRIRFHTNSDHSLQNTFSYKLRSLITEYVFIQAQITHYRIRFHTNWDHSLQNTFSYKLRSFITEYVFTQPQITHYKIRTYSVMSHLSLYENVFCNESSVFVWKRIL